VHQDEAKESEIDFAVVGAGVAGTYVAWRLAKAPAQSFQSLVPKPAVPATVHLFEGTKRPGGRLLTAPMPGMPFNAELGGMRYATNQLILASLVDAFRLDWKEFDFKPCLSYLRGYHLEATASGPYRLGLGERGKSPEELVKHAIRSALTEVTFSEDRAIEGAIEEIRRSLATLRDKSCDDDSVLTAKQWGLLKRHGELHKVHLYDIGFWNLVSYFLSPEAFLFAHDGLGYESVLGNWNAAEAIPWFLRMFGANYRTLKRGMESVPLSLAAGFEQAIKDKFRNQEYRSPIHEFHTLDFIEQDRSRNLLRLSFKIDQKARNVLSDRVLAKHVILALPKEPLINLIGNRKFSSDDPSRLDDPSRISHLLETLDSVTAHPLFKLFLGYPRAWWHDPRALGCASGKAYTDLPIRQLYCFGPDKANDSQYPRWRETSRAMVMASYSDAHYVDFWKPLQRGEKDPPYYQYKEGPSDPLGLDDEERRTLAAYGASERMVNKAHRQLKLLFSEMSGSPDSIPDPYVALVMDWAEPPFHGGWHSWKVKAKPWEVMPKLTKPLGVNLYICGEAYSCEQGWAEGALRSAELVLNKLGLTKPPLKALNLGGEDFLEYIGWCECQNK
jgi:flavin-dependent amine oxidoreductase